MYSFKRAQMMFCNFRLSDSTAAKKNFAWWRGMQRGLCKVLLIVEQALLMPFCFHHAIRQSAHFQFSKIHFSNK